MKQIINHYEVNQNTMALLSVAHTEYSTLALEENQQFYVRKTPIQIVKDACLEGGSTYDGRRRAVSYRTGSQQKVPIPINPKDKIFAFPTHSPKSFECNWIFYHHVKYISTYKSPDQLSVQSVITFKNGQRISLQESQYILEKQMQRTAMCIIGF
ncbi:competence protein ComK [Schinkia azotoformans]|uniref:competence protein ComK n=1 Tax=Schinkia azotoformans TaxID=1454 RepID=UPI002DBF7B87|nr:competence protein ComK [Schinkia azotoformans]MEC1747878.1 competence protein ComK [Schinkia azotoformans]MEC1757605.1 competence protein ComK [Schinkia azotoformans]MEC1771978.1 competence protein ComK [Schinkia azotoformans]MED4366476.1 competence protein ComK [Schinkia azotoformans]MED4378669.1 competence protein ComK [Schinkia azotoformans]